MSIQANVEGTKATISLEGKLTVNTSPELSAVVDGLPGDVCDIDIDLQKVDYVASAGLRVFVAADKMTTARGGGVRLLHPNDDVLEVLEMTGLSEIFDIVS